MHDCNRRMQQSVEAVSDKPWTHGRHHQYPERSAATISIPKEVPTTLHSEILPISPFSETITRKRFYNFTAILY